MTLLQAVKLSPDATVDTYINVDFSAELTCATSFERNKNAPRALTGTDFLQTGLPVHFRHLAVVCQHQHFRTYPREYANALTSHVLYPILLQEWFD